MHKPILTSVLCVMAAVATGLSAEQWVERGKITHHAGNLKLHARWNPTAGLRLRITPESRPGQLLVGLYPGKGLVRALPGNAFRDNLVEESRFNAAALPDRRRDSVGLVLKVRPEEWTLYLEDRPVVTLPAPFEGPATLAMPEELLPPPDDARVRFQRVAASFRFEDNFLRSEDAEYKLAQWELDSGVWELHTARKQVEEYEEKMTGTYPPQAARSPNFYSLRGAGTNALISAGYGFYDRYDVATAVEITSGEMGVAFYIQDTQNFWGLTVKLDEGEPEGLVHLWKRDPAAPHGRRVLGAVTTALAPRQWVRLRARTYTDRVQCFMDDCLLIDVPVELPPGGRFGLFVNGAGPVRFDDVLARSNPELDLSDLDAIRRHKVAEHGQMLPARRRRGGGTARTPYGAIEADVKDGERWLCLGSPTHGGHVFAAEFTPRGASPAFGLIAGYTCATGTHYRFVCRPTDAFELFTLEAVTGKTKRVVESVVMPRPDAARANQPVRLMCDAAGDNRLRLYRNDELVIIHNAPLPLDGASGIYLGVGTGGRVAKLEYGFERRGLYRNRYEKNPVFSTDPYMRHWSSPEGQWIWFEDGATWFKGDLFGRFSITFPHATNSVVHLGVEEGQTNGTVVVDAGAEDVVLRTGDGSSSRRRVLGGASVASLAKGAGDRATYAVHREGRWIWLSTDGKLLFKSLLDVPFKGTRVRVHGFTPADLKLTRVEQYNVKDYLFTESPHEWLLNGGRWDVVNRFQCDPRWSHMNGESFKGLAALWAKSRIRGDFCAEMYVGIRHGTSWYARCGDLNMTVMNRDTSPSQGYTVTCTGWDHDHSQLHTRLYRNGAVVAESDKYLAPRARAGNVRKGYVPLISKVSRLRDVHGAWYYAKLRRIGGKLEYCFDNELVFSHNDEEPMQEGSFGVWTFLNSLMIARVKVSATHIEPKPVAFTPVTPDAALSWPPDPAPPPVLARGILNDGRPLDMTLPEHWEIEDPVGHSRMLRGVTPEGVSTFAVRNTHGSGPMFARCTLPPVPCDELAGWTFSVKRTPGAGFNVHYSIGTGTNGAYTPGHHYFHRISGTDFSKGDYKLTGETTVPGTPATNANWHTRVPWTPVDVWLPCRARAASTTGSSPLMARFEGFGNLQPSYVLQGLHGNAPGETYAVKGLTAVRCEKPRLSPATNAPAAMNVTVLDGASGRRMASCPSMSRLQQWIDGHSATGIVRALILHERESDVAAASLSWINLPATPDVACTWSTTRPDTVELKHTANYPDPRFRTARIATIGGRRAYDRVDGLTCRWASLPRIESLVMTNAAARVPVTVAIAGKSLSYSLAYAGNTNRLGPALVELEGPTPFFENYERGGWGALVEPTGSRMRLEHHDPVQGRYLGLFNPGAAYRLKASYASKIYLSRRPVAQFRYRTGEMGFISMRLGYTTCVNLGEAYSAAKVVRHGAPLVRDDRWHTWCGIVADAMPGGSLSRSRYAISSTALGSAATRDQTGRHSALDVDDFVFGPAVSKAEQLTFTPHYFDFRPGTRVFMAVHAGATPYCELPAKNTLALRWREIANAVAATPPLAGLEDGVSHFFLKAVSDDGITSPVTDIPFLLDRGVDVVTNAFAASSDALHNGTILNLDTATDGGAPLELSALKLQWNGEDFAVGPFGSSVRHAPTRDRLALNWPYILREQLNAMTNGQGGTLTLTGIRDGAGNAVADHAVPIKIDYSKDKTPPTLVAAYCPSNVLWCADWEKAMLERQLRKRRRRWAATAEHAVKLVRKPNREPYFSTRTVSTASEMWQDFEAPHWDIAEFPNLSFRMRRPKMTTNDTSRIYVLLAFADEKTASFALAGQSTKKKKISPLPDPIQWQPDTWHTVNLNIPELLAQLGKTVGSTRVSRLMFCMRHPRSGLYLQVQNVFVFAPWRPEDTVSVDAYDASGLAGIEWGYAPAATGDVPDGKWQFIPGAAITPATLPAPPPDHPWIALRARDKAGHVSFTTRLPIAAPPRKTAPPFGERP